MAKILKDIGDTVRRYRKEKNISTAEFAQRLGVSAGLINNIENARNDVFRLDLLDKIMKELSISPGELLQFRSVDAVNINRVNNSLNLSINESEWDDEVSLTLNEAIDSILKSYLNVLLAYGFSQENIKLVSQQTNEQCNLLIKLHRANFKTPTT